MRKYIGLLHVTYSDSFCALFVSLGQPTNPSFFQRTYLRVMSIGRLLMDAVLLILLLTFFYAVVGCQWMAGQFTFIPSSTYSVGAANFDSLLVRVLNMCALYSVGCIKIIMWDMVVNAKTSTLFALPGIPFDSICSVHGSMARHYVRCNRCQGTSSHPLCSISVVDTLITRDVCRAHLLQYISCLTWASCVYC